MTKEKYERKYEGTYDSLKYYKLIPKGKGELEFMLNQINRAQRDEAA